MRGADWELIHRPTPPPKLHEIDDASEAVVDGDRRQRSQNGCIARCGVLSVVMICLIIIAIRLSCVSTRGECARGYPLLFMFFGHRNRCMPSNNVVPVLHSSLRNEVDGFWMFLNHNPDLQSAYLNIGETKCFDEHIDAARAFGVDCTDYQCSPLDHIDEWTRVATALRSLHLDTVQFTRHWEWSSVVHYKVTEIVLLRWNGSAACVDAFQTQNGTACKCAEGEELRCELQ